MITRKNDSTLKMKTLSQRANEAFDQGYLENFKVINKRLTTADGRSGYEPAEISLKSTFRYEGYSDPQDTSILYLIETHDGKKGTLIDAYGVYADVAISTFVKQVTDLTMDKGKSVD
jgi:hypothetical protein